MCKACDSYDSSNYNDDDYYFKKYSKYDDYQYDIYGNPKKLITSWEAQKIAMDEALALKAKQDKAKYAAENQKNYEQQLLQNGILTPKDLYGSPTESDWLNAGYLAGDDIFDYPMPPEPIVVNKPKPSLASLSTTAKLNQMGTSPKVQEEYAVKYPFKPAPVTVHVENNVMSDQMYITIKIGVLQQKAAFAMEVIMQAGVDGGLLEIMVKQFHDIIQVRPDVITTLKQVVNEAEQKYQKKSLTKFAQGGMIKSGKPSVGRRKEVDSLPGLAVKVKHPVTGHMVRLEDVIISLNDQSKWTREQIADWLDTLSVDLSFKTAEPETQNKYDPF